MIDTKSLSPESDATGLRVSPLVSVIRMASARNSPFRFVPIARLFSCNKYYLSRGAGLLKRILGVGRNPWSQVMPSKSFISTPATFSANKLFAQT